MPGDWHLAISNVLRAGEAKLGICDLQMHGGWRGMAKAGIEREVTLCESNSLKFCNS